MDDTTQALSPLTYSLIQSSYLDKFTQAFGAVDHFAIQLFYILAALEIAFFGLTWALKQQEMLAGFLIKIIKLGMIFFMISHFQYILEALVNGFAMISLNASGSEAAGIIFNPDDLWKYGFDSGMSLLQLAVQYGTTNLGITLIYLILGFGILIMLALIATQVIILVVGFYVVSLLALILLPFSSFVVTQRLGFQALKSVIEAGARIFALIMVLGGGIGILTNFQAGAFSQTTTLDQPLGLFFALLVIGLLSYILPIYASRAIGDFGDSVWSKESSETHVTAQAMSGATYMNSPALTAVTAASNMAGGVADAAAMNAQVNTMSPSSSASANTNTTTGPGGAGLSNLNQTMSELTKAAKVQKQDGMSRDTLNKLKNSFKEVINQK